MAFTHVGETEDFAGTHQHDTVREARECEAALADWVRAVAEAEIAAERGHEQWLENGGAAHERIWWEAEQDRLRSFGLIA